MITAQGRESFNKRSPLLLLNQAGKSLLQPMNGNIAKIL